ncbi:juvenile hormone acid O-methyltransferase-like [Pectinophora gossypiella]|uniref:juvenile hormone acid O-methyltransferase-like n=1 Tax=Pectinophora gossypiella TaxID=13191 RepID=UPI00214E12C6|nr:juvenile hormone acid O-methyltransferase-like [Pectinophora gossypiella]
MSMHNPALYQKFISFQKRDAWNMLKNFGSKMKWKNNASVIDLGSGDGFVTSILKEHLPPDFKRVIGVDISKEMVEFANEKYGDERTSFTIMDIGGKVPEGLEGGFDHAFSSYAIQFIPDQEAVFKNINSVLKDSGSCLLTFLGKNMIFDTFAHMGQSAKWRTLMENDLEKISVRYYKMENAAGEVKRIMEENGFSDVHVENNDMFFEYEALEQLTSMVESGNLFHLPPDRLREFIQDFSKVIVDATKIEKVAGKPEAVRFRYKQLIAYGVKQ